MKRVLLLLKLGWTALQVGAIGMFFWPMYFMNRAKKPSLGMFLNALWIGLVTLVVFGGGQ